MCLASIASCSHLQLCLSPSIPSGWKEGHRVGGMWAFSFVSIWCGMCSKALECSGLMGITAMSNCPSESGALSWTLCSKVRCKSLISWEDLVLGSP